jgi:D-xylose 1-dehydrogenase (NADP+, D-xylono-1,5-lactone-forming)
MFSQQHDNVDMMNSVLLEFPRGVGGMLQFGMWCDGRNEITILGSKGSLFIPDAFYYEPPAAMRIILNVQGNRTEEQFESINHYVTEIEDFNRSVMKGESHPYAPDDSVANMRIIDAVRESAKERKRVVLTKP